MEKRVLCISPPYSSSDSRELVEIIRKPAQGLYAGGIQPASMWSGDGQWIYYASAKDGDWDIYRIHPDGTGEENLTDDFLGGGGNEIYPTVRW